MANGSFEAAKERFFLAKNSVEKQREHPKNEEQERLYERENYYEGLYYLTEMFQEIIDVLSKIEENTAK